MGTQQRRALGCSLPQGSLREDQTHLADTVFGIASTSWFLASHFTGSLSAANTSSKQAFLTKSITSKRQFALGCFSWRLITASWDLIATLKISN